MCLHKIYITTQYNTKQTVQQCNGLRSLRNIYKAEWLYTVAVKCCTTVVQRRSGECEKCRDKYINACERASSISSYVCAYIFSFLSCLLLPLSAVPAGGDAAKCE